MPLTPATPADGIAHDHGPFSAGPARLTLMPAEQMASLDPYMAQIVTYRKSGLSLNHIIGCPLNCGYCVRHFWGDFEHKTPHLLCDTGKAIELLLGHEAFRPGITPLQLFNKATDPFLPAVKPAPVPGPADARTRAWTTWSWSSPGSPSPQATWPSWRNCATSG